MNINRPNKAKQVSPGDRKGAVTVEFALTVPVLILVAFGCVEIMHYNLVKNVAIQASFEAARIGVKPGATTDEIIDEARYQMKHIAQNCDVEVVPSEITSDTDSITVTIQVDIREHGWLVPQFINNPILVASFTIQRDNVSTY